MLSQNTNELGPYYMSSCIVMETGVVP